MPPQDHYYADGRRVPLEPSSHYVAIATDDPAGFAASPAAASIAAAPDGADVLTLPEHGLVVIHRPEGDAAAVGVPRPDAGVAGNGAGAGPRVFESPEVAPQVGMIPTGEVIVRFAEGADADAVGDLLAAHGARVEREDYPEPGTTVIVVDPPEDTIATANALHEDDLVEYAEPNFLQITAAPTELLSPPTANGDVAQDAEVEAGPADPGLASQWGLQKIRAPQAWDISSGRSSIAVAVIDEGCDLTHEDITYRLPGYDAYDGDNTPQPTGNDAHGTACAGIVSMRRGNGRGGVGVAPGCEVMPVRIARGVGGGSWDTTSAKVADAIRTAVQRGADVLSNSYRVGPSTAVTNAFRFAQTTGRGGKGCPIAAATGNGDRRGVIYPARLSPDIRGFLAVGASNEWDQRKSKTSADGESWWGSNFGPEVDVVAPGVHIYTTDIMGGAGYRGGNYTPAFNGTSSATPHVAGVMGLVLSVDPQLRSWEVEDIIKLSARELGPAGRDEEFGFGRVDARRALEAASRVWYAVTVQPVFLGAGRECFMRVRLRIYNPGINRVRLDRLRLTSHTADWSAEVDRMEHRANPGGIMRPGTGDDVRFSNLLLRANGTEASWTYRWSLSYDYTFWRPSDPALPLDAPPEGPGSAVQADVVRGAGGGGAADDAPTAARDDRVEIDTNGRAVTFVLR